MLTAGGDGEIEDLEDYSGILNKLRNYLLEYYEPVQDPAKAEMHLSTREIWGQLQSLVPCEGLNEEMVAQWMHLGGFTWYDYGEMKFEWMMKRKAEETKL